ncbi:hypothetical protein [Niallia oryzisoli]|uniref:hypothetical protein n=1 Tax=Niallia oryzisoli TaxID=1737571 RepID=UPI0037366B51
MTRIPEYDRNIMEQAIYLPMVLTILNRDLAIVNTSPFKLKQPYTELIEETMKVIQYELKEIKQYMLQQKLKVMQVSHDNAFTGFLFMYQGFEEQHNYFNPRIRNKVQEMLSFYLFKRYISPKTEKTIQ